MRKLLCVLLVVTALLAPVQSWAAVAYVSDIETADGTGAATTLTLSNVVGSGGNIVIAFFTWRRSATQAMTGATYGGNAMTQICTTQIESGGAIAAWYYLNPAGTANVVGTWDVAPANIQGTALVFSDADVAGTPLGTATCGVGGAPVTAKSGSVTINSGGMAVDGLFVRGTPTSITANLGQTERSSQAAGSSVNHRTSTEPDSGDGTLGWTWTNNSNSGQIIVPINAAAGGGGGSLPPNGFGLLGVGR